MSTWRMIRLYSAVVGRATNFSVKRVPKLVDGLIRWWIVALVINGTHTENANGGARLTVVWPDDTAMNVRTESAFGSAGGAPGQAGDLG